MILSTAGKVLNRIILNRIRDAVDEMLRENQAGFRPSRSTSDQIATRRIIVEQSVEWRSKLYFNVVDEGTSCRILHDGGLTEKFSIKTGVR